MPAINEDSRVFTDNFNPAGIENKLPSKYYAPPTVEELQELRETEFLFRSNLIRLQIDELLKELQLPDIVHKEIDEFVQKIKSSISQTTKRDSVVNAKCSRNFLPPLSLTSSDNTVTDFTFLPPVNTYIIGSYSDKSILWLGKEATVDLMVVIPKDTFIKSDFLNMRYFVKRALYAEEIMNQLTEKFNDELDFKLAVYGDDYRKPYLIIFPKGKDLYRVRILFVPEKGTFTSARFDMNKSSLRQNWYSGISDPDNNLIASPLTNQSILADLNAIDLNSELYKRITSSVNYVNSLKLLKVWLKQHNLSSTANGFTNFIGKSLLAILIGKKKVSAQMSHYQVFRCILSYLASITSLNTSFGEKTTRKDCIDYPTVILWEDGILNISSNMALDVFTMVQNEAKQSIEMLDQESGFHRVFIEPKRADLFFDNFISVSVGDDQPVDIADFCNLKYLQLCRILPDLLRKALTDRILLLVNLSAFSKEWTTSVTVPDKLIFGVVFSERFNRIVDKSSCPENDKEFSDFWGPLSEVRKFNDGNVLEAVVWPCTSEIQRHHIWTKMVAHTLKRHLSNEVLVNFTSNQLDDYVAFPANSAKDMLAYNRRTTEVINEISDLLHSLEGLPLIIGSVWSELSTVFRGSEPTIGNQFSSIPIVCKLEVSTRWPKHLSAIRRLTFAFCIRLCRVLRQRNLKCALNFWKGQRTVLLSYKDHIFRIFLLTDAEIKASREECKLWTSRQWEQLHVCTWLSGIQFEFPIWPYVVCLCKRWMSANLLLDEWSEVSVEILCAYVFTKPQPFTPPRSLILAFKRFLTLISTHNWYEEPIMANIESITADNVSSFLQRFKDERNTFPPATIVTSGPDNECPLLIHKSPSALLVKRTIQLAEKCLSELSAEKLLCSTETKVQEIFNGSMNMCDIRIVVDPNVGPVGKDCCFGFGYVDFNPVEIFLQSLKESYGQFALFLFDKYGGEQIGVVWKKSMLEPRPLTVQSASAGGGQLIIRKRTSTNRLISYDPMQFIEQWKILGLGIVKSIHGKSNH